MNVFKVIKERNVKENKREDEIKKKEKGVR